MSDDRKGRDWLHVFGTVLVIMGISVWGVYVIERYFLNIDVTGRQFLSYHLAAVIPGMLLRHHRFLISLVKKQK